MIVEGTQSRRVWLHVRVRRYPEDQRAIRALPALPRATCMPFAFQIVQGSSNFILIAYEFAGTSRIIDLIGKDNGHTDSWMAGRAVGGTATRRGPKTTATCEYRMSAADL